MGDTPTPSLERTALTEAKEIKKMRTEKVDAIGRSTGARFLLASEGKIDPNGYLRTKQLDTMHDLAAARAHKIPELLQELCESEEMKELTGNINTVLSDKQHPHFRNDSSEHRKRMDAIVHGILADPSRGTGEDLRYLEKKSGFWAAKDEAIAEDFRFLQDLELYPFRSDDERSVIADTRDALRLYEQKVRGGNVISDTILATASRPHVPDLVERTNSGFRLAVFLAGLAGTVINFLVALRTKNYKATVPWIALTIFAGYGHKLFEPEEKAMARELASFAPGKSFDGLLHVEEYAVQKDWSQWKKVNEKIWNGNTDMQKIIAAAPRRPQPKKPSVDVSGFHLSSTAHPSLEERQMQTFEQQKTALEQNKEATEAFARAFPKEIQEEAWAMLMDGRFPEYVASMSTIENDKLRSYLRTVL